MGDSDDEDGPTETLKRPRSRSSLDMLEREQLRMRMRENRSEEGPSGPAAGSSDSQGPAARRNTIDRNRSRLQPAAGLIDVGDSDEEPRRRLPVSASEREYIAHRNRSAAGLIGMGDTADEDEPAETHRRPRAGSRSSLDLREREQPRMQMLENRSEQGPSGPTAGSRGSHAQFEPRGVTFDV
jgi:hypothetical protein